jgi:LCP family protein required for cell wall assembly
MRESRIKRIIGNIARTWRRMDRVTRIVLVVFILFGGTTSALAFNLVYDFIVSTTSFQLPGLALQQGEVVEGETPVPVVPQLGADLAPWDGASRVNILFMGLDHRDWEANEGAPRTDSMILFTIDPVTKTAGMLSIPRDLWVEVPGFGHQKINAAYQLGEGSRLPGGGPGLAVKTVEQFLGVTIHYYAQVDFFAFERFIDEIGGVKIEVEQKIRVQLIGQEETELIQAGRHTLNGEFALAYARQRTKGDGDFDRARRQQQLIIGIRNQLLRPEIQALILSDGIRIYQELSSGVNTNMTFDEMLRLGWLAKDVDLSNIRQGVIAPPDMVQIANSPDGLSILKPITENIRLLRDDIFSTGSVRSAVALNTEAAQLAQMEAATVQIYNGSGTDGLAESTSTYLQSLGVNVAGFGSADAVGGTTVYLYSEKPYTLQFLVDVMGIQNTRVYYRYDPNSQVDIEVILGPDWVVPQ